MNVNFVAVINLNLCKQITLEETGEIIDKTSCTTFATFLT